MELLASLFGAAIRCSFFGPAATLRRFSVVFLLFAVALLRSQCHALAPPHPSFTDYETVYQYRKRLNITYGYKPKYLSDEHCKHWTEAECQYYDEEHGHAVHRRHGRRLNPSVGTFKVLVLLVNFPEADVSSLPDTDYFKLLYNGGGNNEVNTVGSIREWLLFNSVNKYDVKFDIIDWQQAENSEEYYSGGVSGRRNPNYMKEVFTSILTKMDAAGFNFSPYDSDNDNKLDHLMVVTSGYPAEIGSAACTPDSKNRIWSQGVSAMFDGWTGANSGMQLNGFTLSSAWTFPLCGTPTTMAIPVHEYLHGFNLVDLYDFDFNEGSYGIAGVGSFDMMCNAYGWNNNGRLPGHAGPYGRIQAGWLEWREITRNGIYTLQPSEMTGQVYVISQPYPHNEYLLIENRWGVLWSADWACNGIVIWHVDDNAPLQSERGYPGHAAWPNEHYRVAVLQADGAYDIEHLRNLGDMYDCWTNGTTLGKDKNVWPNTASYANGELKETGIEIKILTAPSYAVQIQVTGL